MIDKKIENWLTSGKLVDLGHKIGLTGWWTTVCLLYKSIHTIFKF